MVIMSQRYDICNINRLIHNSHNNIHNMNDADCDDDDDYNNNNDV